ncbi:TWiK family of potassium channels protein 18-like [Haliotis rufescens]|uniref:TWiK family of potassium channels protein 18-like n=1 Tax=Haliotis rufescens TaxID=6454 RepID=UPI00201F4C49|nr:TWiK family of potassium channels protein 18-like [Haliotis rufescens]
MRMGMLTDNVLRYYQGASSSASSGHVLCVFRRFFKIENHSENETPVVEQPGALRQQLVASNAGTVNRPIRKPRKRDKKKKKKKCCNGCCSCCCCCKTGDKVAGTESEPETEPDSGTEKSTGCCSCCPSKKSRKTRQPSDKKSCVVCCKRFTTFVFSHIGLCSLVVAYSVLGGFIFMKLEAPSEVVERNNMAANRKQQVLALWNLTVDLNVLYEGNWTQLADDVLKAFQKQVYTATKEKGWDGKDGEGELQWSFAGALLYSVTVITTIGYGHIAPKTMYGQLVTMLYALIGIPLTLLCLANLGSFMGDCFRCLYKQICIGLMWLCCPPQARAARSKSYSARIRYRKSGDSEEENPLRGKTVVEGEGTDVAVMVEEEQKSQKEDPVRVPMFVSLMIIVIYIFGGALIFSNWEGWDYLIGSYFCFITLSTIGFGDYVPGAAGAADDWDSQEKLIICAFYLVVGLSLIAMCFNLMQEEVRAKFAWLGIKLGILDKE